MHTTLDNAAPAAVLPPPPPASYLPTVQAHGELQAAYDHFNAALFGGTLPACLITLQRKNRAYGYFSPERFKSNGELGEHVDEIAMNPNHFGERDTEATLSTLVHEMVHAWQQHYGSPPKRAYHDRQWAAQMRVVGLIPSDTAAPGGKETGQRVSHYIEPDGRFQAACRVLLATGFKITWSDAPVEPTDKKAGKRVKYTCPGCGLNSWAKHEASLICGDCDEPMAGAS